MTSLSLSSRLRQHFERESMRPDLGRGIRAMFAVMAPLLLYVGGWLPFSLTFVVFAAQSVAIVDIRGAYTLRLGLLLAMTAILAGSSALGAVVSNSIIASVLGAALIAAGGGIWRHFLPDYGASLAVSSVLLYAISVNSPPATSLVEHPGIGALAGGLWGVFLQVANWPIHPQHPLRRTVSDSWIAVADLFAALAPEPAGPRSERIRECESILRTTLDHTYAALAAARATPLRQRLDELNLAAARLATRVVALNTALESLLSTAEGTGFSASLQPLLTSLANLSRNVAVAVVSRQPGHLAVCEVRVQRLLNLLRAIIDRSSPPLAELQGGAQLRGILKQIEQHLPHVLETLRTTIDRAGERAAFSLELFDLDTWTLRPLASAINLHRPVDPALLRFTARIAVLLALGVAAFKLLQLPHGYWLPLTMVMVLQPDYGSTRQRAAQRVIGTLAGSIAASLLLWLHPPVAATTVTTGIMIFFFAFFLKRQYAVAVFFITLAVVLLTEAHEPITLSFTIERLASTLAGGLLAWQAALFFWPVWERERLPSLVAAAIEANRDFARLIAARFRDGGSYDTAAINAKRHVEAANSAVFSSLQRMMGDPRNRREGLEHVAASANGNQRVTRALTVLALQLTPGLPLRSPSVTSGFQQLDLTLDRLIHSLRPGTSATTAQPPAGPRRIDASITRRPPDAGATARERWVLDQLARIATELNAMLLATPSDQSATASDATMPVTS